MYGLNFFDETCLVSRQAYFFLVRLKKDEDLSRRFRKRNNQEGSRSTQIQEGLKSL